MVAQQCAGAMAVDTRDVGDVVAVGLEPAHHRVLGVEDPILPVVHRPGVERPVVADLVRTAVRRAGVQAVAAVVVVGLPGGVGGLEQQRRRARVIAHDEDDVTRTAVVGAHELGEVDARDRRRGHRPAARHGPVAAVDQTGGRVVEAVRLVLRQCGRRIHARHLARAEAAVVAHAVDVEAVGRRVGADLERDRGAAVHADVGRETLDARVATARDVPLARRTAGEAVLRDDRIRRCVASSGAATGREGPGLIGRERIAGGVLHAGAAAAHRRGVGLRGRQHCGGRQRRCARGRVVGWGSP